RLFHCPEKTYESVIALVAEDGSRFLTRRETPTEPLNYYLRSAGQPEAKALTQFPDPAPALRGVQKQIVTCQRGDGVQLTLTVYTPPGHKPGDRLPTLLWAYPREFNDPSTAGQVSGSPYSFTRVGGISHLFALLAGYAVVESSMPVVGDPET